MIWVYVLGGIAAWLIHLCADASLVRLTCTHHAALYAMHAITVATAGVTMWFTFMSWRLRFAADEPHRFLGGFGLVLNAVNLALILLEGSFILFIHPCA